MSGGRYPNEQFFFESRQKINDDPLGIKAAQRIANGHLKLALGELKQQHDIASDHGVRGMIDGKMWDLLAKFIANNPRKLPIRLVSLLVSADRCAQCLGELDTGWECNDCGYDWKPWMNASTAINDEMRDRREP